MSNKCSALVNGVCLNGFMVTPHCNPVQDVWKCFTCGQLSKQQPVPPCMSEKISERQFPETGAPTRRDVERAHVRARV